MFERRRPRIHAENARRAPLQAGNVKRARYAAVAAQQVGPELRKSSDVPVAARVDRGALFWKCWESVYPVKMK